MTDERQALRDWHRLFGLLLTDYFTGSPFVVEVERDLSVQQQFLDVVVVRRGRGRFVGRLPDGLEGLVAHNLVTFKSHHEALDTWAVKELVGHYVAYRKLVSPSPSKLLSEEQFRLYAVCARLPQKLSQQVPWQERRAGVYDCLWGTDTVRVVVAGELPREPHNAPLHLFSASTDLAIFGGTTYRPRSEVTSLLLRQLFEGLRGEDYAVAYTIADFNRDYVKKHFPLLTPEAQEELARTLPAAFYLMERMAPQVLLAGVSPEARLAGLSPEARLAGLSEEEIRQYLDKMTASHKAQSRRTAPEEVTGVGRTVRRWGRSDRQESTRPSKGRNALIWLRVGRPLFPRRLRPLFAGDRGVLVAVTIREHYDQEARRLEAMLPHGPRVGVLGSTDFWHADSEETCSHIGRLLAGIRGLVLLTGGVEGIGEAVGRSFFQARRDLGQEPRVYHVLPEGEEAWDYGETLFAGSDMTERREILGRLSGVFFMVEGGPRAGHEADVASAHGAVIIPVGRSGGYAGALFGRTCRPPAIDPGTWAALGSSQSTPVETAKAVLDAVQVCVGSAS